MLTSAMPSSERVAAKLKGKKGHKKDGYLHRQPSNTFIAML